MTQMRQTESQQAASGKNLRINQCISLHPLQFYHDPSSLYWHKEVGVSTGNLQWNAIEDPVT